MADESAFLVEKEGFLKNVEDRYGEELRDRCEQLLKGKTKFNRQQTLVTARLQQNAEQRSEIEKALTTRTGSTRTLK